MQLQPLTDGIVVRLPTGEIGFMRTGAGKDKKVGDYLDAASLSKAEVMVTLVTDQESCIPLCYPGTQTHITRQVPILDLEEIGSKNSFESNWEDGNGQYIPGGRQ